MHVECLQQADHRGRKQVSVCTGQAEGQNGHSCCRARASSQGEESVLKPPGLVVAQHFVDALVEWTVHLEE